MASALMRPRKRTAGLSSSFSFSDFSFSDFFSSDWTGAVVDDVSLLSLLSPLSPVADDEVPVGSSPVVAEDSDLVDPVAVGRSPAAGSSTQLSPWRRALQLTSGFDAGFVPNLTVST